MTDPVARPDPSQLSDADLLALLNGQPPTLNPQTPPATPSQGAPYAPAQGPTVVPGRDPGVTIGGQRASEPQALAARQLQAMGAFNWNEPHGGPHNPIGIDPKNPVYPQTPGAWYFDVDGNLKQNPELPGSGGAMGFARSIARGVPVLGAFADEADAATNAAVAPLVEPFMRMDPNHDRSMDLTSTLTGNGTFGSRYAQAENFQRLADQSYDTAHPGASILGRGAGMVASGAAAKALMPVSSYLLPEGVGLLPRAAAGAFDGATMGAAQGYGSGYGGWTDPSRISGAEQGAVFGGGAGATFPVASSILGSAGSAGNKLVDALMRRRTAVGGYSPTFSIAGRGLPTVAPGPYAADDLMDAVAAAGASPSASVSPTAAALAYNRIAAALSRQGQSPADAVAATRGLGPFGQLADTGEAMRDLGRVVVDQPGAAGTIGRNALDLRQLGTKTDGVYGVRPASTRIADSLAAGLGVGGQGYHSAMDALLAEQKAAAAPAYAAAYNAPPVPTSTFADFASSPRFQDAYDRARRLSQSEFVPQPTPANDTLTSPANDGNYPQPVGGAKLQPLPAQVPATLDWRTLDLIKQGMDDASREGVTSGIGRNEQRAIAGYNNAFVAKLDALNPQYGNARAAFAGPAKMMDALDAGRAYMGDDAPTVAQVLRSYSPSEQSAYRLGAAQAERDRLAGVKTGINAADRAGVTTPGRLDKLQQLFPDQQSYADYSNMLDGQGQMFATRNRILGGSQTSRNVAQADDANPLEHLATAVEVAHDPASGIPRLLGHVMKFGSGEKMDEPTRQAVASILFSMNKNALPGIQEGVENAARRTALAAAIRRLGMPAGVQGAVLAGQQNVSPQTGSQ